MDNYNNIPSYADPTSPAYNPIKAEKRADNLRQEAELKAQANAQQLQNDTRKTVQDAGGTWQDKGMDTAEEAKLKAQAAGKSAANDVKDWGDKAGDALHEGVEKVKGFFHKDDRVE